MRGVLYVSHGSRVAEAVEEAKSFIEKVKVQIDIPLQEICFLELTSPNLSQGFEKLVAQGATQISIVPVLLLSAGHYFKDIPAEIEENQLKFPNVEVSYGQPLGVQRRLTSVLKERIAETGIKPNDDAKVLVIGRGSYNPQTQKDISAIRDQLYDLTELNDIDVCYLAACGPKFEEALQQAVEAKHSQIFVVPYLWFTGILEQHIDSTVNSYDVDSDIILCHRLGHHKYLQHALRDRVLETFELVNQ
ncbi:sirohydrochlorin chelatase [Staphylococcus gallinarum]|uniref:CbiX protein n=1 Tax=Staphylococcus gallinarum TaxID=1293 RepID=A0A0D0SUE5_STAGA|nr:sirohydrochlorin chelatase [Staphylococcus gallinarum]KIR12679.1 sirohydrochlorin ferrochelatase [Staphylococcus gallinarum]MCD8919869.1 sirohydrochlorin chelatase [Staphylococcus gallinarum]RTX83154.1 sirohydrochlorin chelatase [Staphylococcus gallinarum]UEH00348.1 sirohydrochlorin chelatase [Staphylococcus gallinarum]SUM31221.1 CbiX protein [Staphylococcus gallinarum]